MRSFILGAIVGGLVGSLGYLTRIQYTEKEVSHIVYDVSEVSCVSGYIYGLQVAYGYITIEEMSEACEDGAAKLSELYSTKQQ
jgi:hypothetical protein